MEKSIRSVEGADAQAVRDIYAPFVTNTAASFEIEPPDVREMARRIEDLRERFPWLVYEAGGEVMGYAYAAPHRARKGFQWCVETSVYVHALTQKRGVGRALYVSLFELLRRQGYVNAYASITFPNPASVRLHESMGFTPIGVFPRIGFKFGKWHDLGWWQLRLQEAAEPVPDPVAAKKLFEDPSVRGFLEKIAQEPGSR
jgi:L-amino acid N-acyltransferase YncA